MRGMKTKEEIQAMLDAGLPDGADGPSRWPGMTYEQGVEATVLWVTGDTDENPLAELGVVAP